MSDYTELLAQLREDVAGGEYSGDGYRYVEVLLDTAVSAIAAIEALVKERDEQGSCWDEGMTLPVREGECAPMPPKCELPHGHGGAHRAGRHEWMRRDSYNSVVAERDELRERLAGAEEGLFRVVVAIGEDTDGARTARDYFGPLTILVRDQPPITDPVGITIHLVSEYRREMEREADIADARIAEAERARDELAAVIEKAQQAGQVTGYSRHKEPVMKALDTAPADARREHDAALIESLADEVGRLYFGEGPTGSANRWGAKQAAARLRERARQVREGE